MKPSSWQALSRVFVVFGLLWGSAQAQEATIKRATELREAPGDQAASRGALAADSSVARTGDRKGSWVKVRTPQGTEGWVHMFDLGSQPATASSNSTAIGSNRQGRCRNSEPARRPSKVEASAPKVDIKPSGSWPRPLAASNW